MGVTDVQLTDATLPVGVPDVGGLGEPVGSIVPLPEGDAGLPLGASGLPVTEDVGLPVPDDSAGTLGEGWFPPLCSRLQPPNATVMINKPGRISAVAHVGRILRGNVVVGMTRA